jgi:signal peptidase II
MPEFTLFHQSSQRMGIKSWALSIALSVVFLDQLTKWLVSRAFVYGETLTLFPGFAFTLRHNTGAAFSFLADAAGWQRWFFVVTALIVSVVIFFWLNHISARRKMEGWSLALILGGAWGNVIDRIYHGYVIDFILIYYQDWQFPAFNIADTAISVGVALFILQLFRRQST